jgi:hypothetical protein
LLPVVWSHARKVIAGLTVPLKFVAGTKRMRVLAASDARRRADVPLTLPSAFQLVPLFVEYSHDPFAASAAMTAIPSTAPASTSVIRSPPALAIKSMINVPVLATASSRIVPRARSPPLSRTGASLTAVTLIANV